MSPWTPVLHQPISNPSRARYRREPSRLFVEPLLPTLVTEPPEGPDWEHEIKYDGYRTLIVNDGGKGRAFTRNGHDWTERYSRVVGYACRLGARSCSLDGEMIVQDESGRSNFEELRSAIERPGERHRLVFMCFDLLELDGYDMRAEPLRIRREALRKLVGSHDPSSPIQFSESLTGSAAQMLEAACGLGLEGIVSKKLRSTYRSGRQKSWLKTKCYDEEEFTVIGADHKPGQPAFALLAREGESGLEYAGSAFLTLGAEDLDRFWTTVEQRSRTKPVIRMAKGKKAAWVEPVLRVRAQFLKGSDLRHASIRELL